jgi:hypothetical protein
MIIDNATNGDVSWRFVILILGNFSKLNYWVKIGYSHPALVKLSLHIIEQSKSTSRTTIAPSPTGDLNAYEPYNSGFQGPPTF